MKTSPFGSLWNWIGSVLRALGWTVFVMVSLLFILFGIGMHVICSQFILRILGVLIILCGILFLIRAMIRTHFPIKY